MLVLSRFKDEVIDIGDNVSITVVKIEGGKVKIGIDAPKDVKVNRREVTEAIARSKSTEGGEPQKGR
jgi:carbon storage regulator